MAVPPLERGKAPHVNEAQAGIRRLPISAALRGILQAAAEAHGLRVHITSGGQPVKGTGTRRTGSTRHDVGGGRMGAADLQLIDRKDGHTLDMTKAADQKRIADFITTAVAHGAVGVGAHPSYMGSKTIHVGGGSALSWGSGGRSATAPNWLRAAHSAGLHARRIRKA